MQVIVTAYNKDRYVKQIICMDEKQVRLSNGDINDVPATLIFDLPSLKGPSLKIDPRDYPEMEGFIITVEP